MTYINKPWIYLCRALDEFCNFRTAVPIAQFSTEELWRGALAVAGLFVFLTWEYQHPLRALALPKAQRYAANLVLGLINPVILQITLGGLAVSLASWATVARFGILNLLELGELPRIVATVAYLDFVAFILHRLYHGVPLLWSIHQVHHSDIELDVTTAVRFHPLEMMLSAFGRSAVIPVLGLSPIGIAVFEMVLLLSSQFQHCNRLLPHRIDNLLKSVIVTPNMHRIHHSIEVTQMNSNFSTIFTWWDRLFRTYRCDLHVELIETGLTAYRTAREVGLTRLWLMPLGACKNQPDSGVEVKQRSASIT
jgi:sterol desaturase/sphingolipid hydroxylase (fatty acid hydroxylase superfamily)